MPTVPRLDIQRVGPSVRRAPQESAASQPGAGLVAGLGAVADRLLQEQETARQRGNEIRLNSAEVKVRELRNRILNDREKGVLNLRGERSFKAPEDAEREWVTGLSAIGAELGDPDVRAAFQARADQLGVELRDVVNRHVTREMDAVDELTTKRIVDDTMGAVSANASDEARVGVDIVRAEETLRNRLTRQGVPEGVRNAQVAQVRSNARLAQIEALANVNPDAARESLVAHLEEIDPLQREKARAYVDAANLTAKAQRVSDDIYDAFRNDEAGAIREAERTYEGKERDAIVNRLEVAFARQRRLRQEEIGRYTDEAMTAAYQGRSVPRATAAWLESNNQGRVLRAAQEVQKAAVEGEPVQTNLATYSELRNLLLPENRKQFLETNLLAYSDRISRSDLIEFIDAQVALRGGTTRPASGVATSTVLTETFKQAQGSGMFDAAVTTFGDIEARPEDKEIFNVLRGQVETNLAALRESQSGEPSTAQVREVIRQTIDGYIIEQRGVPMFRRRVAVPTSEASPDALARAFISGLGVEVTSAKVGAIVALQGRTDLTPAQKRAEAERIARGQ